MGSMSKVMQKIQEAEEQDRPPADASAAPASELYTSPPGTAALESSFVPGEATANELEHDGDGAAAPAGDGRTSHWDPQRVDPVIVAFHDRYSADRKSVV